MEPIKIKVCNFSITPGPRYRDEGTKVFSGQEFREDILEPKFKEALEKNQKLIVDLDGTIGYGTSWLEEVFGGLSRAYGSEKVLKSIDLISKEEEYLIDDIKQYIEHAQE